MFNKSLFNQYSDDFFAALGNRFKANENAWNHQLVFHKNFDLDAFNYKSMIEAAIEENSSPDSLKIVNAKKSMLQFIDSNEDLVRTMFRDLFSDQKDLEGRIGRFIFHCDKLQREIEKNQVRKFSHFHDRTMVIYYLSWRFPFQYAYYDYSIFAKAILKLGAVKPTDITEMERFQKIMRLMGKFLYQHPSIAALEYLGEFKHPSLLLANDFIRFVESH